MAKVPAEEYIDWTGAEAIVDIKGPEDVAGVACSGPTVAAMAVTGVKIAVLV